GIGPEDLVALWLPRSAELIVAWLAVFKSGAGYVPIDPGQPEDRARFMLEDARPDLVLTLGRAGGAPEILTGFSTLAVDEASDPASGGRSDAVAQADRVRPLLLDNPAYVIYTSGSTGRPKGVAVAHRSVVNVVRAMADGIRLGPGCRHLLQIS